MLKRMRRPYTRRRFLEIVEQLRKVRPEICLSTDVIVGFPGETEADFTQTLQLLEEVETGLWPNPFCTWSDPGALPAGLDWNLWLGPAPAAPYCDHRTHWDFRWILDYSGGQVTDWGAHHIDIAHWGLGLMKTGPTEVEGAGEG